MSFDYSKWDNIDTSGSEDEDEASATDAMQALHDYGRAHGMDTETVGETLEQCGGDPAAALDYLSEFLGMDDVMVKVPAPAPAPARQAPASAAEASGSASASASGGAQSMGALSAWELEEELAAGIQQIHELRQKQQGNAAALTALQKLERSAILCPYVWHSYSLSLFSSEYISAPFLTRFLSNVDAQGARSAPEVG